VGRTVPGLIGAGAKQTPHEIKNLEGESPVLIAAGGFVVLFDGKTLKGWEGDSRYWKVEQGTIVGRAPADRKMGNTFLYSKKKYRDFELQFQVRLRGGKGSVGNSGVQIRSTVRDAGMYSVIGPQCEIGNGARYLWGSLLTEPVGEPSLKAPAAVVEKALKPDDYNDYFIRCVGKHVTIRLNGQTTVSSDFKPLPDEGVIAWQLHGGHPGMEVVFRHIRFRELNRTGQ
jgi:Domain of Unknown Function (DUF1080)